MERKFYPENFERFLKGHADQFKMSPSKKVWHGIYNDLHPGRRWPSIAMTMVFIFTLVIVGHLNTNNGNIKLLDQSAVNNLISTIPAKTSQTVKKHDNNASNRHGFTQNISTTNSNAPVDDTPLLSAITDIQPAPNTTTAFSKNETKLNIALENRNEKISIEKIENGIAKVESEITKIAEADQVDEQTAIDGLNNNQKEESVNTATPTNAVSSPDQMTSNLPSLTNAVANIKPKKHNTVNWVYYITPSLSYRNFSDERINNAVFHKARVGYEAGTAMSFNIYKKLQFTTGIQINFSGYKITANNTHPIVATLMLNSETAGQYDTYYTMSTYGNKTGSELTTLKNYSLQASLPIGLQYVFAANDNVQFGAAAAFQPSIVIASKAYLLSSDKRNYLMASDLLRNINMSTNFSTYVSFASNTFNWQIGPQIRYQLLSTYSNRYPVKEHLVNYGIRLGISKISK